jgi:hypothetical protein
MRYVSRRRTIGISCSLAIVLGCQQAAPGALDLQPVELWHIDQLRGQPAEPRLADDGTVTFHDFENHISYLYDAQGKEIARFAPRGDQPGEVLFYLNAFWAGQTLVVAGRENLHLFDNTGQFLRTYSNDPFEHFPLHFLDAETMLVAPSRMNQTNQDTLFLHRVDLATGESHPFAQAQVSKGTSGPPGLVVLGLTPQAIIGHCAQTGRFYWGQNDSPIIHVVERNGQERDGLGVQSQRRPINLEDKVAHLSHIDLPQQQITDLAIQMPDSLTYYRRLQVQDGRLWVFPVESIERDPTSLPIHIYDDHGNLLFHARLLFGDWRISGNPNNVQINGGRVAAILVDDAGERRLAVYRITLP